MTPLKIVLRTLFLAPAITLLLPGTARGAEAEQAAVPDQVAQCVACHGEAGAKPLPGNPILAGQHYYYLYVQLKDFKSGLREHAVMGPIAAALDKPQMKALAQYFSEQKWPGIPFRSDPAIAATGETAISAGQCVACHLGNFSGDSRVPRLSGQLPDYLERTMLDFKTKSRKNSPAKSSLMESYSEADIAAMANFLGGL